MGMPASAYIPSNATLLSGGAPSATSIHPIGGIAANTPAQPAYHGAAA
jgi:hypothetical protein